MKRLFGAIVWVWDFLPMVLLVAAAGFVFGAFVQGSHLKAVHEAALQKLRADHLQEAERQADARDQERAAFIERLAKQQGESNAKHAKDAERYADLQRTLDRMRDAQATEQMYLRATAESAAARAATAEELFGICRREYVEVARKAGLHALDLQDALVR